MGKFWKNFKQKLKFDENLKVFKSQDNFKTVEVTLFPINEN